MQHMLELYHACIGPIKEKKCATDQQLRKWVGRKFSIEDVEFRRCNITNQTDICK